MIPENLSPVPSRVCRLKLPKKTGRHSMANLSSPDDFASSQGSDSGDRHSGLERRFGREREAEQERPSASPLPVSARQFERFAEAIEADVIPRLLMAYRQAEPNCEVHSKERHPVGSDQVAQLTDLLLDGNRDGALAFLDSLIGRGAGIDILFLDLLGPVARRLGTLWDEDIRDFTEVTMAMGQLTCLVHHLARRGRAMTPPGGQDRRALLATPPEEQHGFGLVLVSEFMNLAGWHVTVRQCCLRRSLIDMVRNDWFSLAGFSVTGDQSLDWLTSSIAALRRASRNPDMIIMVGGKCFLDEPELVAKVGADMTARNCREAVERAEGLIQSAAAVAN